MLSWVSKQKGFTIVELLIVIVVIAILAAITIVAYNGIQNRAKDSSLQAASSQAGKKVLAYAPLNNDAYPEEATFRSDISLPSDTDAATYDYYTSADRKQFCISVTNTTLSPISSVAFTQSGQTVQGRCVKNLASNPGTETTITGWANRKTATVSRQTTAANVKSGVASIVVTTPGTESDEGLNMTPSYTTSSGVAGDYNGSAWVKGVAGTPLRLLLEEYTSGNIYVASSGTSFTTNGNWQRISATRNITTASSKAIVNVRTTSAIAATYYVDDVMITQGPTLYTYGDGLLNSWSWTGAANNGPSFGPTLP